MTSTAHKSIRFYLLPCRLVTVVPSTLPALECHVGMFTFFIVVIIASHSDQLNSSSVSLAYIVRNLVGFVGANEGFEELLIKN